MTRTPHRVGGLLTAGLAWLCGACGGGVDRPGDAGRLADSASDAARGEDDAGRDGPASPFAVRLVSFEAGEGAGFGQDRLPAIVLGPPRGGGLHQGSKHVVSLGTGGHIVVELGTAVVDGPGVDLLVFENPFRVGGAGGSTFSEPGYVAVSEDGESFTEFPCEPENDSDYPGCAGVRPVLAHSEENDLDATDPSMAGGDRFDLADIGVTRARFVRIRDAKVAPDMGGESAGFDLDAVAAVHDGE